MTTLDTTIPGALIIEPDRFDDERGSFATVWSREEFRRRGLIVDLAQYSVSFNRCRGTLRGMHYQMPPHEEVKIVRCSRGAIYDVLIDLRRDSPSYKQWIGVELTPFNNRVLYVPKGVAHGYQTLADDTEVTYLLSTPYASAHARGVRWDDPAFDVQWPDPGRPRTIHARDAAYPDFRD